jgi:hypothetical protein
MRRNQGNKPRRKSNPFREMVAEQQRESEILRALQRAEKLQTSLPSLIKDQVGEHMQKLEDKLLQDFKTMGQRAIDESTAVLNDQLHDRIETLEHISSIQSGGIVNLRDSSKSADQKVMLAVNSFEKTMAKAAPDLQLEPPAHPAPQIEAPGEVDEYAGRHGYCPKCTSTNLRRAYRKGLFEELLRLFFIAPFRCRACRHKFYRF